MGARIGITTKTPAGGPDGLARKMGPYVRAVERAGGEATLLENDASAVDAVLAAYDGIVLSGGVDVDPARYGGAAEHANSERDEYHAERDAFEIALARAARERGVPTLAICRGLQVANVAFGGTLVEDLADELGAAYVIRHRQTAENGQERGDYGTDHVVTLDPASRIAAILGANEIPTNTLHHQAVRRVADAFAVVGRTADGVVEACELREPHPFFIAVQWHPEELTNDANVRLFESLVEVAAARAARV